MKIINEVLEKVYNDLELRRSVVPLFIGNPGLGKTVMIDNFAKKKKVNLVELITSQMSPFEISGIAMPDKETQKMIYYNFDKLENLKDGDILFFDELLNGNPIVLNACLTILEQRKLISGKPLPDIMIVAAANPQGMTPLTPQIKERFIWYNVDFNVSLWGKYMKDKYLVTDPIVNKLANLIKNESFTGNNFYTPRSVDKAVNMILKKAPTPYEKDIKTILSEMITNPFSEEVILEEEEGKEPKILRPGEMITWLELIKIKEKINKKHETIRKSEISIT
jgi:SpoVK/Ycf46/Vps4 family AAA+-type ATPase